MPRVLVVDDDPATGHMLCRLLRSRGVPHVTHVTTVAEALGRLAPPPDWLILDLDLPDGLGLEVLDALRVGGLPTRVVVSSATEDPALLAAVAVRRPDVIIPKPLDPALLPIGLEIGH
jgi:CheY-like chemotaxis protein